MPSCQAALKEMGAIWRRPYVERTNTDVVSVTVDNDDLVTMQFGRVDQASTWVGSGHFYHLIGRYLKLFHQSEVAYFQIGSATSIFDKSRLCLKFNLNQKFAERILLILSKSPTESQTG